MNVSKDTKPNIKFVIPAYTATGQPITDLDSGENEVQVENERDGVLLNFGSNPIEVAEGVYMNKSVAFVQDCLSGRVFEIDPTWITII